jgi:formylmethanofuran dehydrogenase subunit E
MTTFSEYLDKMGYSWNDFDRTYEMENLIEQYANERVTEALRIHNVVGRIEQLVCEKCQEPMIEPYAEKYGKKFCLGCM